MCGRFCEQSRAIQRECIIITIILVQISSEIETRASDVTAPKRVSIKQKKLLYEIQATHSLSFKVRWQKHDQVERMKKKIRNQYCRTTECIKCTLDVSIFILSLQHQTKKGKVSIFMDIKCIELHM